MTEGPSMKTLSPEYTTEGITSSVVFKGGRNQTTLFCMAEGTDIEEHTSTKEGYVYVIEGAGIFNLKGEDIAMKPGVLIQMEKDAVHSLKAHKNTAFLLFLNEA